MKKIILFFLLFTNIFSQSNRETRAVWLTTNFRLDWPPQTFDAEKQKSALEEIFIDLHKKNFNTVYFQVLSKNTALYKSEIIPFSPYISGIVGDTTTYDPLQLAIDLARKYGLEIHAWVNVVRIYSGSEENIFRHSKHISNIHPEWAMKTGEKEDEISYWLNFGIPEARNYMVQVISEIAQKYDIDGIHMDFLRYPDTKFDDSQTYSLMKTDSLSLGDWRRENLNKFVQQLSENIRQFDKTIKLGAAPFGIYKNLKEARGSESYFSVFQDSRNWIAKGWLDYLTPQIYWDINRNPRFDVLAEDWVKNSDRKNIVLGIAAYKPDVYSGMSEMIEISRKVGASGVSFFRYNFIKDFHFNEFDHFSYPTAMPWLSNSIVSSILKLHVDFEDEKPNSFTILWEKDDSTTAKYFSFYEISDNSDLKSKTLLSLLPVNSNSISLTMPKPKQILNKFQILTVDELWNESDSSVGFVEVEIPVLKYFLDNEPKPISFATKNGDFIQIHFFSKHNEEIAISENENKQESSVISANFGWNIFSLKLANFTSGELILTGKSSSQKLKLRF